MGAMAGVIMFELLLPLLGAVYIFFMCGAASAGRPADTTAGMSADVAGDVDVEPGGTADKRTTPLLRDGAGEPMDEVAGGGGGDGDDQEGEARPSHQSPPTAKAALHGQMTIRQMLCTLESPLLLCVSMCLPPAPPACIVCVCATLCVTAPPRARSARVYQKRARRGRTRSLVRRLCAFRDSAMS